MIEEQNDQEGSSAAAIGEIVKYDSEDLTAKGSMGGQLREEKEEMTCGENAEAENKSDETIREINEVVESIAGAVFDTVRKGNIDQLENRSSNTLGMRVKDSLILKVQQTQKKAAPWIGGIRASQLVCHLRQISCEDDKDRFLRSPVRTESPALSSESESPSTRQKKSVSLAENVEVFNRLENEVFIENEAGIAMGEPMIDDRENAAESEDKICGFIGEESLPASVAGSVSFVSVERDEETLVVVPISVDAEDVEEIEENYSQNNLPNTREIEMEKESVFQSIEGRPSFSFSSSCSKKSVEILQNNLTTFLSSEPKNVQNLNTTSSDDSSLKLINVEEETEVKNSSIKSNQSLPPEIVFSQVNSALKIDENFEPKVEETESQLLDEEMDRENLFVEMLASVGYIVENLDSCTELLTVKSKEGEVSEGSKSSKKDARDKLTSDIEKGVEQVESTIGERENEIMIDGNEARIFRPSLKSSENFGDEDLGTFSLNAVTAMCDSTLLNLKNNSEERIFETEVLIVDHISDDKLKNDRDDDEGVGLSDPPDQRFNSESLSNISAEINAEELSEEFEIRLKKHILESEDVVVVEKSSYTENATSLEDRDDRRAFKLSEKKFIAAIVEGENLVKFATVSPGQKAEKESKNFIGKEAAVSRKVEMEAGEINDPEQGKSSDYKDRNDRDLGDDFSTENKDGHRSGSGNEKLSREKSGKVLTGDEKLQNRIVESAEETRSGSTSWKTTLSKVSIKRRKLSEQSSETGKDCTKLFESGANSAMELSRRENNRAITPNENFSLAIETLLVIDNDKPPQNTIEEVELFKENKIQKEKCGETDFPKVVIRSQGKEELKVEREGIQDSGFSLQKENSSSTLREERIKKTDSKWTEICDEIKIQSLPAEDNKEVIQNRSRDKKETESVKKFANSLSRIFSSHSSRKRNVAKGSSSRMEPQKHFKPAQTPQASSDDRKVEKKNADTGVEDNGEELVAVKSLDSMKKAIKTTYHVFLAAAASEDVEKEFPSENQEAEEFFPNFSAAKGAKNDPKDRPENSFSQENRPEKKRRKSSSGKRFAKILKLFSKASTKSENETNHRVQKQSMDEAVEVNEVNEVDQKQRTESGAIKQVSDDHKVHKNGRKVPFDDDREAGVAADEANEVATNYEQQVSCPESREDRRYRPFFGVRSTNSGIIDHLERLEMRTSVAKNPPDESGADSTTPSIEDGGKKTRGKGVGETESVFSRTMKRLFKRRGSAADSISSRPDTCSILSRNDIVVSVVESGKSCTEKSFEDEGFAVLGRAVTDCGIDRINREEIRANLDDDCENYSHTSESKSAVLLLGSRTAKKSFDALTKAFHESSKRSATSSDDDMIETSAAVRNSTRNTFAAAFTTTDNTQGETLTFTRDFDSIPFGRRKSIVVMMATPEPPRKEVQPEASSTSEHRQESSSSSTPTAFYYLLGPTLDEALLDMKAVFQKLIDKIAGHGAK